MNESHRVPDPSGNGPDIQPAAQQSSAEALRNLLDDSGAVTSYANLCRVSATPEEVILDLALNPNPLGASTEKVRISQRVVLTHYTAKRLAGLLAATVQRHEQMFGPLETDVRKRVKTP